MTSPTQLENKHKYVVLVGSNSTMESYILFDSDGTLLRESELAKNELKTNTNSTIGFH